MSSLRDSTSSIHVDAKDEVAVLHLEGSPVHTIGWDFKDQVEQALRAVERSPDVRAILLMGGPKVFSAGADVSILAELKGGDVLEQWLEAQHQALRMLATFPLPVVAAVKGTAAGAGMNIALAADYIVATDTAKFSQAFIRVGLATDMGSLTLLPRRIGLHAAKKLMYTGRTVGAEEAATLGIVDELVSSAELIGRAVELAEMLGRLPLLAFAAIKSGLDDAGNSPLEVSLNTEAVRQQAVCASRDFYEGTAAFLEKRTPIFTDRPTQFGLTMNDQHN